MIIRSTVFSAFYPATPEIRKKFFYLEEKLSPFFGSSFMLLPVPDNAPPEIPRITANSGHSALNITQVSFSLQTNYDDNFNADWGKCQEYLTERIETIYNVIKEIVPYFMFFGLQTSLLFTPATGDPVSELKNKFFGLKIAGTSLYDLLFKLTFVIEDTYYVNIHIGNVRVFSGAAPVERSVPAYLTMQDNLIGLDLDINDRHAFNYRKEYQSDYEKIKKTIEMTSIFLLRKIPRIMSEGVFNI